MTMKKMPFSVIVFWIFMWSIYLYITVIAFNTPGVNPIIFLMPIGLLMLLLLISGDWLMIHHARNFFSINDGKFGSIIDGPLQSPGGEVKYIIAVPKRYIPEEERRLLTGWKGFATHMAFYRNVEVTAPADLFDDVTNNVEGAVMFWGKLSGKYTKPTFKDDILSLKVYSLVKKIMNLNNTITAQSAIVEKSRSLTDLLSKQSKLDLLEDSEIIATMIRDIRESEKQMFEQPTQPYMPMMGMGGQK